MTTGSADNKYLTRARRIVDEFEKSDADRARLVDMIYKGLEQARLEGRQEIELDIPGTVADLLDDHVTEHGKPPWSMLIEQIQTPHGLYDVKALSQDEVERILRLTTDYELRSIHVKEGDISPEQLAKLRDELAKMEASPKRPLLIERGAGHSISEVEYWKKACALAMEFAGVTCFRVDHQRIADARWFVRKDRDIYRCEDTITIEHEVDATKAEPKYLFLFEGTRMNDRHIDRLSHMIKRWSRSSFSHAIAIELPPGCKLHIKQRIGGDIADVDPDAIGVKIVERSDITEAQIHDGRKRIHVGLGKWRHGEKHCFEQAFAKELQYNRNPDHPDMGEGHITVVALPSCGSDANTEVECRFEFRWEHPDDLNWLMGLKKLVYPEQTKPVPSPPPTLCVNFEIREGKAWLESVEPSTSE
jgi:hypothetical protein